MSFFFFKGGNLVCLQTFPNNTEIRVPTDPSFNKYLLSDYYASGIILGCGHKHGPYSHKAYSGKCHKMKEEGAVIGNNRGGQLYSGWAEKSFLREYVS